MSPFVRKEGVYRGKGVQDDFPIPRDIFFCSFVANLKNLLKRGFASFTVENCGKIYFLSKTGL